MKLSTKSFKISFSIMFKVLIGVALFYTFWGPMKPLRDVTAEALSTTASLIRR